jgi:hypothetical protein
MPQEFRAAPQWALEALWMNWARSEAEAPFLQHTFHGKTYNFVPRGNKGDDILIRPQYKRDERLLNAMIAGDIRSKHLWITGRAGTGTQLPTGKPTYPGKSTCLAYLVIQ